MQANFPPQIGFDVRKRLDDAANVFVLTGAGVSAESGVPTFRGGGNSMVWKDLPFSVISSAEMLESNPDEVWDWFQYRRRLVAGVKPNSAHLTFELWQKRFSEFSLVTQDVDGLHQQ